MAAITDVSQLGTIMGVWAHPDDETWASAGLMARAIKNGQKVVCVTATRGDAGKTANQRRWPQEKLSHIRETELGNALSIVGVHELHWLPYHDGRLKVEDKDQAITKLVTLIDTIQPDTVLTFEPKGITGHDDHRIISSWACAAARKSICKPIVYGACETVERYNSIGKKCDALFDIYFNTKEPFMVSEADSDLLLKLSKQESKAKLEALEAHASQTARMFHAPLGKRFLKKLSEVECFVKLQ